APTLSFHPPPATPHLSTLSLHDALPISSSLVPRCQQRNSSRLRRASSPSLESLEPVVIASKSNAKSPDVPGAAHIAIRSRLVSRSEEHTSELQSRSDIVCRLLLEKKKQ